MSQSNSSFDLYLGDKSALHGYRLRSMTRDSAPLVASKFSTGAQSQSDLDLLKVNGFDSLAGGMFQRIHEDPQKVARLVGVYNPFDNNIYPAPARNLSAVAPFGMTLGKAESSIYSFCSYSYYSTGVNTNYLYKYTPGNVNPTLVALPAAMTYPSIGQISGLAIRKGYLFVAGSGGTIATDVNCQRYNIGAGTWQNIGGPIAMFAEMRGVLYGVTRASQFYALSNEFAAGVATYTHIADAGDNTYPNDLKEFNGAIWVAKPDGIYRFDGVTCVKVLGLVTRKLQVFNGAIYFVSGNWLYKFDGTNVVRVQFFAEQFIDFTATPDYLYLTSSQTLSTYLTSDKSGSYSASDVLRHLYLFDGVGFSLVDEQAYTSSTSTLAYSGVCSTGSYVFDLQTLSSTTKLFCYKMDELFTPSAVTANSQLQLTSSEFNDGFPAVYKSFEEFELNYTGIQAGDSIAVTYQYYNGSVWSSWLSLGTITSTSDAILQQNDTSNKLFKRLKIAVVATLSAGSALTIKGGTWKYTLQPRARWRWQVGLVAHGVGQTDLNGNALAYSANLLNNYITQSIKQKTPSIMLSPDFGILNAGISAAATTFVVKGEIPLYQDPYSEYMLCAVLNSSGLWEIMRVSNSVYSAGLTTVTVRERGYLGIAAATINASAEFHLAYKVYINRLLRESTVLDPNTYDQQTTGESQIKREFQIEIIEV